MATYFAWHYFEHRPKKSAHAYAQIWDKETNESPLRRYTREQAEAVQEKFGDEIKVSWAMRYGRPSIEDRLAEMKEAGCERIAVMALYPQYSATTSASVYDEVFRALMRLRWQPAIRTAAPWHDDPTYINALAATVQAQIQAQQWEPDVIVASFHGLPQRYFEKGTLIIAIAPKPRVCWEALGLTEDKFKLTFQSRFGPAKWLEPYTDKTVIELAEQGHKKITLITPGFISDCVETLEEINIGVRDMFLDAGGQIFRRFPARMPAVTVLSCLSILRKKI